MKTDLTELKRNLPLLLEVVGAKGLGCNLTCPLCGERKLSIFQSGDGYVADCKKASCPLAGDVVAVYRTLHKVDFAEAVKRLSFRNGLQPAMKKAIPTAPPPAMPELNKEQHRRLLVYAEKCLVPVLDHSAEVEPFRAKRGLSWDVLARFGVGFDVQGKHWTFPVVDVGGHVRGLKAHREVVADKQPKLFWMRFSPPPSRCGWTEFFPLVESFPLDQKAYLAEGELKALAVLSSGFCATSPTTGAGLKWSPELAKRFRNRTVTILYDDDDAGRVFKNNAVKALRACAKVKTLTLTAEDFKNA
jgi:DNA primase